jgi:hypothetical protein
VREHVVQRAGLPHCAELILRVSFRSGSAAAAAQESLAHPPAGHRLPPVSRGGARPAARQQR